MTGLQSLQASVRSQSAPGPLRRDQSRQPQGARQLCSTRGRSRGKPEFPSIAEALVSTRYILSATSVIFDMAISGEGAEIE